MKIKKICFEIETEKENILLEGYLRYSLRMLKIENIKIIEMKTKKE